MQKNELLSSWPDAPNPYSCDPTPRRNGALVDEAAMLNAFAEHERIMALCTCDWDINWDGNGVNTPPASGCIVHPEEE